MVYVEEITLLPFIMQSVDIVEDAAVGVSQNNRVSFFSQKNGVVSHAESNILSHLGFSL